MRAPLPGSPPHAINAMYYCHDTFGLGHLRRTLTLATSVRASLPDVSQLIVTGSPAADQFTYPRDTDHIKLPSVTKSRDGAYVSRTLATSIDSITDMRRNILLAAARGFQPDVLLVDHAPAGMLGEAVATLRYLKHELPDTRLIVGLRDVVDEASVVRRAWAKDGTYELLDDIYDLILVYGNRELYDAVCEYGLSSKASGKTKFVGYLERPPGRRSPQEIRAGLGMQTDRLVVVTAGGGGDGRALYEAISRDLLLQRTPEFDTLIIEGPLFSERDSVNLRARLGNRDDVHVVDFTQDLPSYFAAADAVVSMGGYNSVCEILSLRVPAVIVPRTTPRKEQLIRASTLSSQGLLDMIPPHALTPGRLLGQIRQLLAADRRHRPSLHMPGLANAIAEIASLLDLPASSRSDLAHVPASDPAANAEQHSIATAR